MADDDNDSGEESSTESSGDSMQSFLNSIEERYGGDDQADMDREDGVGDDEAVVKDDEADDTDEHPAKGTSTAKPDGAAAESDDDSEADDDEGHPEDDSDPTDDDDDADLEEDEDGISDETKGALTKHGAILSLDDVPEEQRSTVEALLKPKLRNIEAAFTRAQMEATEFRTKARAVAAEERFRNEHPEMFIVEMLEKDPDLLDKVQGQLDKLTGDDQKKVFGILAREAREEAAKTITAEQTQYERALSRGQEVNDFAAAQAKALGVPWRLAERAVYAALLEKPEDKRDLTNAEIIALLKAEQAEYSKEQRAVTRKASQEVVKRRTESRKAAPPAARAPGSAVSPRPSVQKQKVDHNSETSRQAAILRSARRIMPGTR